MISILSLALMMNLSWSFAIRDVQVECPKKEELKDLLQSLDCVKADHLCGLDYLSCQTEFILEALQRDCTENDWEGIKYFFSYHVSSNCHSRIKRNTSLKKSSSLQKKDSKKKRSTTRPPVNVTPRNFDGKHHPGPKNNPNNPYPPEIDVPTNPLPPVNPAVNFDIDGRRHPNPNGGDGYDYPPGQRHKRPEYDYDFSNSGVQPNSFSHQCFSLMSLTLHIALMKVII